MDIPPPPASLPKYLAEGIPKQDTDTLQDTREYIDALLEYRAQDIAAHDLPEGANPMSTSDGKGTIVLEKVRCGDDSCKCASGELHGPYLYRYHREQGTLKSEYLGKPPLD